MEEKGEEAIRDFAQRNGLTEAEVRVFDHLARATEAYGELPEEPYHSWTEWTPHMRALHMLLMARVVRRDYPEGWRTVEEEEDARGEDTSTGVTGAY